MATPVLHRNDDELHTRVEEWVQAGLITPEQAAAIDRYEERHEAVPPGRLTTATEIAAYIGSVLALMGGAAVVGQRWEDLAFAGRLGLSLAIIAVGMSTGAWLMRLREPATARLGSFLWVVGTGGVALAALTVMIELGPADDAATVLVTGGAVLATGAALWRNRERPLQLLTAAVGFAMALGSGIDLAGAEAWVAGAVLLPAGAALAGGALIERIRPRVTAVVAGFVGAYFGAFMLTELNEHLGPAGALVVGAVAVLVALRHRIVLLLVVGIVASMVATQALLATAFDDLTSSLVVAVAGLAVVAAAMTRIRRNR